MLRGLIFLAGIWASGAAAQFIGEGVDVQTAAGQIAIEDSGDGFSRVLRVGAQRFFEDGGYRFISIEDQRGSLYLVSLGTGGTACAAQYVWLNAAAKPARITETFGTCSDQAEVRSDSGTVTVVMPAVDPAGGFVGFVYDGRVIREGVIGQVAAGVGRSAQAWIGRYPFEVFRDADWRDALVAMMGEAGYREAGNVIATSTPFEAQGDWVAGRGFNNRMASFARGAVAIHRDDGRVLVAIRTEEQGLRIWGDLRGDVPAAIMAVLQGG